MQDKRTSINSSVQYSLLTHSHASPVTLGSLSHRVANDTFHRRGPLHGSSVSTSRMSCPFFIQQRALPKILEDPDDQSALDTVEVHIYSYFGVTVWTTHLRGNWCLMSRCLGFPTLSHPLQDTFVSGWICLLIWRDILSMVAESDRNVFPKEDRAIYHILGDFQ